MTTDEVYELFNKLTNPLDSSDTIRAITFNAFYVAILKAEHNAYIQGVEEGMGKLMEAVEKGFETIAL